MTDLIGEPACERCRGLCCRGFVTIPLYPDKYLEDAELVEAGYAEQRDGLWRLPRADNRCAYLDETSNLCLIHAERPRACRDYDCRIPWAARNLLAMLAEQNMDATGTPPWEVVNR